MDKVVGSSSGYSTFKMPLFPRLRGRDELVESVLKTLTGRLAKQEGKSITVFRGANGVGKTQLACSVAKSIQELFSMHFIYVNMLSGAGKSADLKRAGRADDTKVVVVDNVLRDEDLLDCDAALQQLLLSPTTLLVLVCTRQIHASSLQAEEFLHAKMYNVIVTPLHDNVVSSILRDTIDSCNVNVSQCASEDIDTLADVCFGIPKVVQFVRTMMSKYLLAGVSVSAIARMVRSSSVPLELVGMEDEAARLFEILSTSAQCFVDIIAHFSNGAEKNSILAACVAYTNILWHQKGLESLVFERVSNASLREITSVLDELDSELSGVGISRGSPLFRCMVVYARSSIRTRFLQTFDPKSPYSQLLEEMQRDRSSVLSRVNTPPGSSGRRSLEVSLREGPAEKDIDIAHRFYSAVLAFLMRLANEGVGSRRVFTHYYQFQKETEKVMPLVLELDCAACISCAVYTKCRLLMRTVFEASMLSNVASKVVKSTLNELVKKEPRVSRDCLRKTLLAAKIDLTGSWITIGKAQEARRLTYECLCDAKQLRCDKLLADALWTLSAVSTKTGEPFKALACARIAKSVVDDHPEDAGTTWAVVPYLAEANALLTQGKFTESEEICRRVLQQFYERNEIDHLADALNSLGVTFYGRSMHDQGISFYSEALQIFSSTVKNRSRLAIVMGNIGQLLYGESKKGIAGSFLRRALFISSRIGDKDLAAWINIVIAFTLRAQGLYTQSIQMSKTAREIYRSISSFSGEVGALRALGEAYGDIGQLSEAEDCYREALQICELRGLQRDCACVQYSLSTIYLARGNLEQTSHHIEQAEQIARSTKNNEMLCLCHRIRAVLQREFGNFEEARQVLNDAVVLARENALSTTAAWLLYDRADLAVATDDPFEALNVISECIETAKRLRLSDLIVVSLKLKGKLLLDNEEYQGANDVLFEALQIARDNDMLSQESRILIDLARIASAIDDTASVQAYTARIREIAEEGGDVSLDDFW